MSYVSIVVKGEEAVEEWLEHFRKTCIHIEGEREREREGEREAEQEREKERGREGGEVRDDESIGNYIRKASIANRPKMPRLSSAAKITAKIRTSAIDLPTKKEKEKRERERDGKMEEIGEGREEEGGEEGEGGGGKAVDALIHLAWERLFSLSSSLLSFK